MNYEYKYKKYKLKYLVKYGGSQNNLLKYEELIQLIKSNINNILLTKDLSKYKIYINNIYILCKYFLNNEIENPNIKIEKNKNIILSFENFNESINLSQDKKINSDFSLIHLLTYNQDQLNNNDCIIDTNFLISNDKCINFHIIDVNDKMIIGFSGSINLNDFLVDIQIDFNDNFHSSMFETTLKFIFRNNAELYNKVDVFKGDIYLCGLSLGSAYAIYMLIIFRYIFNKNNIYAIVKATLPIIPMYLNKYISPFILSMSHYEDPFTDLKWLKKFCMPKNSYYFDDKNNLRQSHKEDPTWNPFAFELKNNIPSTIFNNHINSININKTVYNTIINKYNLDVNNNKSFFE